MNDISEVFFDALENRASKAVVIYFDEDGELHVEGNVQLYEAVGMMEFAKVQIMYDEDGE